MTGSRTTAAQRKVLPDQRPGAGRSPQPKRAPRVPFALLVVGLIVGGMCALLALNTASAANELARHDVAGKDSDIAAQLEQVRNRVAASAAPGSLGNAAAALGMVPAGAPAFLKIGANGIVTLLGSPAPATAAPVLPPYVAPKPKPTATPPKTKKPKTKATKAKAARRAKPAPKTATSTPTPTTTLPGGTR